MFATGPPKPWRSFLIAFAVLATSVVLVQAGAPHVAAAGPTYKSGWIVSDEQWSPADSPYVLTGHVTVKSTATLTILAGTTVKFDPLVALYVEGSLVADGQSLIPLLFQPNQTISLLPWIGIQFNATGDGSVSWSSFERPFRAVVATGSSPAINNNTVRGADRGFSLTRSASTVADNVVNRGTVGIYLEDSNAQILRNQVNGTGIGIQAVTSGSPLIEGNVVTNTSTTFAFGIAVTGGATADIRYNTIRWMRGRDGSDGTTPGEDGTFGGVAAAILVTGAPTASIVGNTIDQLVGGRGGNGFENAAGVGGSGGVGGSVAGIAIANVPVVTIQWNNLTTLAAGRGGNGGGNVVTAWGGDGGVGGDAYGIQLYGATTSAKWYSNSIGGPVGGYGGNGGPGTLAGNGAAGGSAWGLFLTAASKGDATGNTLQDLRGGLGGNSTSNGAGSGRGGSGGASTGIGVFAVVNSFTLHGNTITTTYGGDGGRGRAGGGAGGNATALLVFGYQDGKFNATGATVGTIQDVRGGDGGMGASAGGDGGSAIGILMALVTETTALNQVSQLQGGRGGDATGGANGGRGGDAAGYASVEVRSGISNSDSLDTSTNGVAGAGAPIRLSYGVGMYFEGNASLTTRVTVENATIVNTASYDLYAENYSHATTVSTVFGWSKVHAAIAANVTVKNFLSVNVFWPDGITLVAGGRIHVDDNGGTVWDVVAPAGEEPWLLVTDRVYAQADTPTENTTDVSVSYLSYNFANNPRSVTMSVDRTEDFLMTDEVAPSSTVSSLPSYETTSTFSVAYTASDAFGSGLADITLYYRKDGSGGWIPDATQPAANAGSFSFTAPGDGVYEFTTVADDQAGNVEPGPSANDTWTIVDTARPASQVASLSPWTTLATFLVSWAPEPGTMDIASYTIQYNNSGGWTNWLVDTAQTSALFTASPAWGVYQFRSISNDAAGNVELLPATNDTWTRIDTGPPASHVLPLPTYETATSFLVTWAFQFDSFDTASYRIDVSDNGGAWTTWIAPTGATSATFTGAQDGHVYQFRSIATDYAGNVEAAPAGNDTWTLTDLAPPNSVVAALPQYESSLQFPLAWGPESGSADIASYTIEVSDNDGPWTAIPGGGPGTTATSATFTGLDGHRYAFRSIARDYAGNPETPPAGNDTWTNVDVTPPSVTDRSPRGSDASLAPAVVVVFSEPMNHASAEQAFTINPDINGDFSWSADSKTMTFTPARALQQATPYVVVIDTSAQDLAGNRMTQPNTFSFTTAAAGFGLGDAWPYLLLAGIAAGGALFIFLRRRAAKAATTPAGKPATAAFEQEVAIDDVFLLYRKDGILIKHETRRLRPDIDTDILSGMLTAVQQFVKDSFQEDAYEGELNEITFGEMHLHIGRGKWIIIAARVTGGDLVSMNDQIKKCIQDMEDHNWDRLEDWDGDMELAKALSPYLRKLIRGEYV